MGRRNGGVDPYLAGQNEPIEDPFASVGVPHHPAAEAPTPPPTDPGRATDTPDSAGGLSQRLLDIGREAAAAKPEGVGSDSQDDLYDAHGLPVDHHGSVPTYPGERPSSFPSGPMRPQQNIAPPPPPAQVPPVSEPTPQVAQPAAPAAPAWPQPSVGHASSDEDETLVDQMLQDARQRMLEQIKARRGNPADSPINKIRVDAAAQSSRIRATADAEIGKLVSAAESAITAAREQLDTAVAELTKIRAIQEQAATKQREVDDKATAAVNRA